MPNGISDLAWAPDGSRIDFISLEGEEPMNDPKVISPGRHRRLWTVRPDHTIPEPAVPVAQAYAFYRALRERNVPVELVVYPREGHGLSEKAHLRDAIERQLRWFERYLQ